MNRFGLVWSDGLAGGLDFALRSTLVLAAAWLLTTLLKERSAATRHVVWASALVAVLVLPLAQQLLPAWRILPAESEAAGMPTTTAQGQSPRIRVVTQSGPVQQASDNESAKQMSIANSVASLEADEAKIVAMVAEQADGAEISSITDDGMDSSSPAAGPWSQIRLALGAIWLGGVALLCLPVVLGTVRLGRLRRSCHAAPSTITNEVRRLSSELGVSSSVEVTMATEREMPMTWGLFTPVLLLPVSATEWSSERRRMVLVHELAHIRRRDCLTQFAGQLARALYWFNPLAWLALHRLRIEQERACDDVVLNCGADANEYASELLSVTARLARPTWDAAVALAMSRSNRIEQRLKSILNSNCERRPVSLRNVLVTCGVMALVVCGVAAAERQKVEAALPQESQIASANQGASAAEPTDETPKAPAAEKAATKQPLDAPDNATPGGDDLPKYVLDKITRFSPTTVDSKALNEAAIRGMLQSLNDPYSTMMSTQQTKELHEQINGKLVGIGAALKKEADAIEVTSVMPNSPALRGGLKARDVIVEIDGQPATELGEAVKRIRGLAGTDVTLKIRRADKPESLTFKRAEFRLPTIKGLSQDEQGKWRYWLDPDQKIALVQITQFDQATPGELQETLASLKEQGLKGLILDLRGNVGGLLQSCDATARLFLKEGTIVEVRGRQPQETTKVEIPAGHTPLLAETPLVVLIDPTTASAAEVLAAALKDNNRAILLGERTFGKGSVQSILPLGSDGASLKLTTALMFSPSGQSLHRGPDSKLWGVDPNDGYYVPLTSEQQAMRQKIVLARETGALLLTAAVTPEFLEKGAADPQLAAALKALSTKLKTGEFAKTGRQLTDLQAEQAQKDTLRKQREELRAKLEQLDRQLGESH